MAERFAAGEYDQLIISSLMASGMRLRWRQSCSIRLVGGGDAVLVNDDTAMPKKGTHSVGVAAQYASALGKTANC
jgi:SRSO17 transposase